jgi:hypothetical protein
MSERKLRNDKHWQDVKAKWRITKGLNQELGGASIFRAYV